MIAKYREILRSVHPKLTLAAFMLALSGWGTSASAEVSDAELAANAEAMATGKMIYQYDQAAWHSTDALLALIKPTDYPDLRGWVVEPYGAETLLVTYFGERDGGRYAILRYVMRGSTVVEGGLVAAGIAATLSPLAERLIDARDAATERFMNEDLGLCTDGTMNSVILPPDREDRVRAYLMSSATTAGVFPLGGHYRFDVDANSQVTGWRQFLTGCINVDSRPGRGAERKTAYFVTHLLDPQPSEIHYFVRFNLPLDIAVGMKDGDVWLLGIDSFKTIKVPATAAP